MHMRGGWQKITWRVQDSGELNMGLLISGDASWRYTTGLWRMWNREGVVVSQLAPAQTDKRLLG